MTIQGTIKQIKPVESGEGWQNQLIIIQIPDEKYPKTVAVKINPEKVSINEFVEGEHVTAHINIESREYNDRFYTDVKAWKIERN
jgi:CTP-dependent riboflavin kinase